MAIEVARARGCEIWDSSGKRYLDFIAGIGVANVGHRNPMVLKAIRRQAQSYLHVMVYGEYVQEPQVRLAQALATRLGESLSVVYFTNSGAEAVEGALKAARKFTRRNAFVAFDLSFHGDTFGALSVCGNPTFTDPFRPLLPDVRILPYNEIGALARIDESVAAVIVEPVQAEAGVRIGASGFLRALRERTQEAGALLIFDEIITGFRVAPGGAQEYCGVTPDVAVFGKAMANGFPISAMVGKREFMRLIESGAVIHAGTYNTNLMVMAAADATMARLAADNGAVYQRLFALGCRLMDGIRAAAERTGQEILLQGPGVMFWLGFTREKQIRHYREHVAHVDAAKYARFCELMLERGVRLIGRGIWYVSAAHTEEDVDTTVKAVEESFALMSQ